MAGGPAVQSEPAALEVRGLGHRFGDRQALTDVSLEVMPGQFVALLGPNGAGKTTLFSVVTRLYDNRAGTVRVFGADLRRESNRALADVGVVFQARTLDQDLTLRQNLAYHAALHGLGRGAARQRIATLLDRVGLAQRMDEKVSTLSGGQARRVEIARALVHAPRLLLLDEPTVGLDLASRAGIVETVRTLVRDERLAVLWATHLMEEVEPPDEVYVLDAGRVVATGSAASLSGREGTTLAKAFQRLTEPGRAA